MSQPCGDDVAAGYVAAVPYRKSLSDHGDALDLQLYLLHPGVAGSSSSAAVWTLPCDATALYRSKGNAPQTEDSEPAASSSLFRCGQCIPQLTHEDIVPIVMDRFTGCSIPWHMPYDREVGASPLGRLHPTTASICVSGPTEERIHASFLSLSEDESTGTAAAPPKGRTPVGPGLRTAPAVFLPLPGGRHAAWVERRCWFPLSLLSAAVSCSSSGFSATSLHGPSGTAAVDGYPLSTLVAWLVASWGSVGNLSVPAGEAHRAAVSTGRRVSRFALAGVWRSALFVSEDAAASASASGASNDAVDGIVTTILSCAAASVGFECLCECHEVGHRPLGRENVRRSVRTASTANSPAALPPRATGSSFRSPSVRSIVDGRSSPYPPQSQFSVLTHARADRFRTPSPIPLRVERPSVATAASGSRPRQAAPASRFAAEIEKERRIARRKRLPRVALLAKRQPIVEKASSPPPPRRRRTARRAAMPDQRYNVPLGAGCLPLHPWACNQHLPDEDSYSSSCSRSDDDVYLEDECPGTPVVQTSPNIALLNTDDGSGPDSTMGQLLVRWALGRAHMSTRPGTAGASGVVFGASGGVSRRGQNSGDTAEIGLISGDGGGASTRSASANSMPKSRSLSTSKRSLQTPPETVSLFEIAYRSPSCPSVSSMSASSEAGTAVQSLPASREPSAARPPSLRRSSEREMSASLGRSSEREMSARSVSHSPLARNVHVTTPRFRASEVPLIRRSLSASPRKYQRRAPFVPHRLLPRSSVMLARATKEIARQTQLCAQRVQWRKHRLSVDDCCSQAEAYKLPTFLVPSRDPLKLTRQTHSQEEKTLRPVSASLPPRAPASLGDSAPKFHLDTPFSPVSANVHRSIEDSTQVRSASLPVNAQRDLNSLKHAAESEDCLCPIHKEAIDMPPGRALQTLLRSASVSGQFRYGDTACSRARVRSSSIESPHISRPWIPAGVGESHNSFSPARKFGKGVTQHGCIMCKQNREMEQKKSSDAFPRTVTVL